MITTKRGYFFFRRLEVVLRRVAFFGFRRLVLRFLAVFRAGFRFAVLRVAFLALRFFLAGMDTTSSPCRGDMPTGIAPTLRCATALKCFPSCEHCFDC